MQNHIEDLEEKLESALENITIFQIELEDNKSKSSEQIQRLMQQLKGC